MDLVLKGVLVGVMVILVGWFAKRDQGALTGLLINVPIFSFGAFWVAATVSRTSAQSAIGGSLASTPVWLGWVITSYLLVRFTSLPVWAALLGGLIVWVLGATVYLWLSSK
jgi:uncharacterized membrane protein (GlpM family)